MNLKKKLVAVSAVIVVPIGLGIAGTAYAGTSTDSPKAPAVSESAKKSEQHGPGHERPEGVEHGEDHEKG